MQWGCICSTYKRLLHVIVYHESVLQTCTRIITFYPLHELFENQSWMLKRYIVQLPCWVQTVQIQGFCPSFDFLSLIPPSWTRMYKGNCLWLCLDDWWVLLQNWLWDCSTFTCESCTQNSLYQVLSSLYIYIYDIWIYAFLFLHGSPWSVGQKRLETYWTCVWFICQPCQPWHVGSLWWFRSGSLCWEGREGMCRTCGDFIIGDELCVRAYNLVKPTQCNVRCHYVDVLGFVWWTFCRNIVTVQCFNWIQFISIWFSYQFYLVVSLRLKLNLFILFCFCSHEVFVCSGSTQRLSCALKFYMMKPTCIYWMNYSQTSAVFGLQQLPRKHPKLKLMQLCGPKLPNKNLVVFTMPAFPAAWMGRFFSGTPTQVSRHDFRILFPTLLLGIKNKIRTWRWIRNIVGQFLFAFSARLFV